MKRSVLMKIFSVIMSTVILLTPLGLSTIAQAENEQQVIRVLFPEQEGLSHTDENGNRSGYMYDYLMKIAQRTGWKYEFISRVSTNEELQAGLNKLENGEIDLAGLVYNKELAETYEYCSVPYGESNFTIVTPNKNLHINERTLLSVPKLTVALVDTAIEQNTYFEDYAETNGLEYNVVYGADNLACKQLLDKGQADLMISKDVVNKKGYKTVAQFFPQPFYFASFKGNVALTEQIDSALSEIENSDPYFSSKIHKKHFRKESENGIPFTSDETKYIESAPPLRVIIFSNEVPIQAYDAKTKTYSGIIIDILNELSKQSGLKFELVVANSQEEAQALLAENKADIVAGIPYDYSTAEDYGVLITSSIFSMPVVRVLNQNKKADNPETLVLNNIKIFEGKDNIKYVQSADEILSLLNSGDYSEGYVDGYMAQHYLQSRVRTNILVTPTPYSNYELCLGVNRSSDLMLISIMEQTITSLSSSAIEDIVYQNTMHGHNTGVGAAIKSNPVETIVFLVAFFAIVVTLLLLLFIRTRQMNRILAEEKTVYKVISDTDRMTKTYNNVAFKEMVNEYLSIANCVPHGALIVCDVDYFKNINDTYGHLVGDQVLQQMGSLLSQIFRNGDVVGRLGGDEFAVLIKDIEDLNVVKDRCAQLVEKSRTVSDKCEVTLSIGVAMFNGANSFNNLFKVADDALYTVKKQGKNGFNIVLVKDGEEAPEVKSHEIL